MTLPVEIQDMIFKLSFPPKAGVNLYTRHDWCHEQIRDMRIPRPYPGPKVNDFMVSKAFFVSAAKVYVTNQRIFCGMKPDQVHHARLLRTPGIFTAFVQELEANLLFFDSLEHCASLKRLEATVDSIDVELCFDGWEPDSTEPLHKMYFLRCSIVRQVRKLRGLQHVTLRPGYRPCNTDEEKQIWESNVHLLEDLIKSRVLLPKKTSTWAVSIIPGAAAGPLYAGSRVRAHGSQLLEPWEAAGMLSSARSRSSPGEMAVSGVGRVDLQDKDIPDSYADLQQLWVTKPLEVMGWIREVKAERKLKEGLQDS